MFVFGEHLCAFGLSKCSLPERAVQWHKLLLRSQTLKAMIPHLNVKVSLLIVSVPLLICHWELFADLLWISNSVHIKKSVHYTVINHLMVSRNKRKLFSSECCWKSSEWVIVCFDCFIFWMSSNFIIVVCCAWFMELGLFHNVVICALCLACDQENDDIISILIIFLPGKCRYFEIFPVYFSKKKKDPQNSFNRFYMCATLE